MKKWPLVILFALAPHAVHAKDFPITDHSRLKNADVQSGWFAPVVLCPKDQAVINLRKALGIGLAEPDRFREQAVAVNENLQWLESQDLTAQDRSQLRIFGERAAEHFRHDPNGNLEAYRQKDSIGTIPNEGYFHLLNRMHSRLGMVIGDMDGVRIFDILDSQYRRELRALVKAIRDRRTTDSDRSAYVSAFSRMISHSRVHPGSVGVERNEYEYFGLQEGLFGNFFPINGTPFEIGFSFPTIQ